MKKILSAIAAVSIFALPIFAFAQVAGTINPTSFTNQSDGLNIQLNDWYEFIAFNPDGSLGYRAQSSGVYTISQLGGSTGSFHILLIRNQFQCTSDVSYSHCIDVIAGDLSDNLITYIPPPPPPPKLFGNLTTSTAPSLATALSDTFSDTGVLNIIVLFICIPLFFYLAHEMMALLHE